MNRSVTRANIIYRKFSFQKKIALFFIITILVLAGIFYAIGRNNQYSVDTSLAIGHTQEVLLCAEEVRTKIDEMQGSVRGFVIAGENQYLDLYYSYAAGLNSSIIRLKTLTADNPGQQKYVDSLIIIIDQLATRRKELITARFDGGFEKAKAIFGVGNGEMLTQQARKIIVSIQEKENALLTLRKADNERSIRNATIIIILFILLSMVLLSIAFIVISKNTKLRNEAEARIKFMNASLEKTIEDKTQEAFKKDFQYRFLLENLREGIQVIGFDWKYLFLNQAVVDQSKYSKEELLGHTMMEKYPGIENTKLFVALQQSMKDRVPQIFENEFTYPDGTKDWFELSIEPVPEGLLILSINITARKQAEKELTEQELRHQKSITEITIQAQEKERNELGKELHDNINQVLATVKMYLGMVKKGVNVSEDLIERSHEYTSHAIEEIRKLSHSLVAPSLGDVKLPDVLGKLAAEASLINELQVEFKNQSVNGSRLDNDKELMLYRIAQEQINNIRKYSKAKKVDIILKETSKEIYFSISDNGIGFDTSKKPNGIGLKNIRSRVEFYSGRMNLISSPGNGCQLEIMVPV